jgi:hypothetical protein
VVPDGPLLRLVQSHLLYTSDMFLVTSSPLYFGYVSVSRLQENGKIKQKREMITKDDKKMLT